MAGFKSDEPLAYLEQLRQGQLAPGFLIKQQKMAEALPELRGGFGLTTPDPFSHLSLSVPEMYVGVTSPRANETAHWHGVQVEMYLIAAGEAQVLTKYRWDDSWESITANAGALIVVRPQACHWFQWISDEGFAWVFKAPQRAGIGRHPKGKTTCEHCPHFDHGCQMPCNSKGQTFVPSVALSSQE